VAGAVTAADLEACPTQDIMSGTAGLLLGLAALDERTGARGACAPIIEQCGRRLLATARPQATGVGWPLRAARKPLCGMAHGNSGVAMALFEAWRLGGPRELRDVALLALDYERSLFSEAEQNWPDLRDDESGASFMAAWCNGAPGIALARSRMLAIDDVRELREDLARAVETTKVAHLRGGHLCCGMGGLDQILFEVGARQGDAALTESARRRTMSRLTEARVAGRWPHVVSHGLMRGLAGIGLGLLRMSGRGNEANEVPCVLDLS
jgi:lantibiotic modifying enzyme